MVARLLSLAVVSLALSLVLPGLSPLSAAQAASAGGAVPQWSVSRHQFRPLSYASEPSVAKHRAVGAVGKRGGVSSQGRRGRDAMIFDSRAKVRKALPVTRGQELGFRFRPDERASPYTQPGLTSPQSLGGTAYPESELQTQFRPTAPRHERTYEELQAESLLQRSMPAPQMPYPVMPGPMPPTPGQAWPVW